MKAESHIIRNVAVMAGAAVALVVMAALLESAALATVIAMLVLGVVVLVLPLVVIHFDEHEERLHRRRVGARH